MKRFILRLLLGAFVFTSSCVGGLFLWVGIDTTDSAEAADQFLESLQDRRAHEAYRLTSSLFRAEQSEERFEEMIETALFSNYGLAPWASRTLERRVDSPIGATMVDRFGTEIPITVQMVRENGRWRVHSVTDRARRGDGAGAWFAVVPGEAELLRLAAATMFDFERAVVAKDVTEFYGNTGRGFRIDIRADQLQIAFQSYIDKEIDISAIYDVEPVLDNLGLFEEYAFGEVLVVEGYYPVDPFPVPFKFRYLWEHPEWKLFKVLVEEPDPSRLSPAQCLKWLLAEGETDLDRCFDEAEHRSDLR